MADEDIQVIAQPDAFRRIAGARPLNAIAELIWNSLDSSATKVDVYFDTDEYGLNGIVIEDNGLGMSRDDVRQFFGSLGGSWKKPGAKTHKFDRILHGCHGQGRYKALSLGRSVTWKFFFDTAEGRLQFAVEILADNPSTVRVTQPEPSNRSTTGCIVHIREPVKQFKNLEDEESLNELSETFALYLSDYPGITISYGSQVLDPSQAILNKFSLRLPDVATLSGERAEEGIVNILEWKHLNRRSMFLCDKRGFALQQVPTKFQLRKHSFSAYVLSPYLSQLEEEDRLDIAELDPLGNLIIQTAKDTVRNHYESEDKKEATRLIRDWKTKDIYPYKEPPQNSVEEAERQVFDIVAITIHTAHSELSAAPKVAQALQLELLRHAIETGPNQLRNLLSRVVDLPRREQDDLTKLLEETTLSSIIGAAKVVTDRLNFLRALYQIVYEYEKDGRIKERSQLHRLLALNPWIFGEEFVISSDDRDLTAALRAHKQFLDDDIIIDEPVKHVDQIKGILDLMLSRLLRRYRDDEAEHLVVELKRPGVSVGTKEITQIERYAASIEHDGRFETRKGIVWNFWIISDKLDDMGKYRVSADLTGRGLIRDTPTAKIYARTWDQLINENKTRYQFIQERLNFSASDDRSMKFLRDEHAALLAGVTVASDEQAAESVADIEQG